MTRRTMLIAGAVAGLVLVLWYLLLWSPRKDDLTDARDRRGQAETLREELAAKVVRLRAAEKDQPMKKAQVESLRTNIPDDPNLAAFILDTNDAASKAGIDWISISPTEPALPSAPSVAAAPTTEGTAAVPVAGAGAAPAEIRLQLQVNGGYFQMLDFLNRLSGMPRLVVTDTLSVGTGEDEALTVAISARMFVRAVPPGYGDVPAVVAPATANPPAGSQASTPASTPPPTATAAPAANPTGARS